MFWSLPLAESRLRTFYFGHSFIKMSSANTGEVILSLYRPINPNAAEGWLP